MTAATVADVYASGLLELAQEMGTRDAVIGDCRALLSVLESNPELIVALDAPGRSDEFSRELFEQTCSGRVQDEFLRFLKLVADRGRVRDLVPILRAAIRQSEAAAGIVDVEVTSAAPLSEATRSRLEAVLRRRRGPRMRSRYLVDERAIAGLAIRCGDELVDDTAATHLRIMCQQILHLPINDDIWDGVAATPSGGSAP